MENLKVLVETSARHVHISREHLDILFGTGYELTCKKELSQPGQFACEERVKVIGPKGEFSMSILGPVRPQTQIEVSLTDARSLGVKAPIKESGDLAGAGTVTIQGPNATIEAPESLIVALRHIHMTEADAKPYGFTDKEMVSVKITGTGRALTFDDVVVRVSNSYALAMHVDVDEANSACLAGEVYGEIIKK